MQQQLSGGSLTMPVVGITTSLNMPEDGSAASQSVPIAYANAVADAGGTPLLLPMLQRGADDDSFAEIAAMCDALVIVGGGVISKGMIGAQPDDLSDTPSLRDVSDTAYLSLAMTRKIPVLGICYGMQFINAHLGGAITADWQEHMGGGQEHAHSPSRGCNEHPLGSLAEGSKIERILHKAAPGATPEELLVNSYHLQGIGPEMLADGLLLTATAAGGTDDTSARQAGRQLSSRHVLLRCVSFRWVRGSIREPGRPAARHPVAPGEDACRRRCEIIWLAGRAQCSPSCSQPVSTRNAEFVARRGL